MEDAGCRMPDAGCKMQDARCRMQDARCRMQDAITLNFVTFDIFACPKKIVNEIFKLSAARFSQGVSCILHPVSSVSLHHSASCTLVSCILHPASSIRHRHPASGITLSKYP